MHVVRRGMRVGKYMATARFKWNGTAIPGLVARWIGPGDSLYVGNSPSDGKARLFLRQSGSTTTLATSGTTLSLTATIGYTVRLVIGDGERDQGGSVNGNASAYSLRFWVDTDADGDWSDETAMLVTTTIEGVWNAGCDSVHSAKPCLRGVPRKHGTCRLISNEN